MQSYWCDLIHECIFSNAFRQKEAQQSVTLNTMKAAANWPQQHRADRERERSGTRVSDDRHLIAYGRDPNSNHRNIIFSH